MKKNGCIVLAALCIVLQFATLGAAQSSEVIGRGFQFDSGKGDAVAGALVSTKANDVNSVELATTESAANVLGVVNTQPLVAIMSQDKTTQVVVSGVVPVLVSDINGAIRAGDHVSASPIAGVGMLAASSGQTVGVAQADFNTNNAKTTQVTDVSGVKRDVHIASLPVQVSVSFYQAPGTSFLPAFVQNVADGVAGHNVSIVRIVVAVLLLLAGFVYTGVLIYTSARSAIVSLGRNPLAAPRIRRGLVQMAIVAVAAIAATLLAAYIVIAV